MLKYQNDRNFSEAHGIKLAPFGGNQPRFERGPFDVKEGPGPGEYELRPNGPPPQTAPISSDPKNRS